MIFYAAPDFVREFHSNGYDYQYGAGRLWGEPVMVKTAFYGTLNNPSIAQLGMAEGMALLGNMGIYAAGEGKPEKESVPGSWVLPMVEFAQKMTPQVRQMVPAAKVGVIFSPIDSFAGLRENDEQSLQVSRILHRQHVPLQVVHLQLLDKTLEMRPLDVLVLPWLRGLKDSQAATVAKFVRNGGKAVFVGNECGTLTWEAARRQKNAFAEILPKPDTARVTFRQVGKGRTALIPGTLRDASLESGQNLQGAFFTLLRHTPSCIPPNLCPMLMTNLTRNSNNSRFWMHLVNYDVDMDASSEAAGKAIRPVENLRVVVPLPEFLRAKSATLYRREAEDLVLALEHGREGCAVTVPRVEIYAVIAVDTEEGERPATALSRPAGVNEALRMVAEGLSGAPASKALVAPPGITPRRSRIAAPGARSWQAQFGPRGFRRDRVIAYATSAGNEPVRLRVEGKLDCLAYSGDGERLPVNAVADGNMTILSIAPRTKLSHLTLVLLGADGRVTFSHQGRGAFEASAASPLSLWEEGDSESLYFYVPKNCQSFHLFVNNRLDRARVYPVRLVVRDSSGNVRLDVAGAFDGMKAHEVPVADGQSGRVWSISPLEPQGKVGAGERKKAYLQFYLQGVPPVVAQAPEKLLIGESEK